MPDLPILYSFRRCPYAIRARLALKVSAIKVELREIVLSNKPQELIECSSKATVPVLLLPDGNVIDESIDIMLWSLKYNDPHNWLTADKIKQAEVNQLIDINDNKFKQYLDNYKYADRFPEQSMETYRLQAEFFLRKIEQNLLQHKYLVGNKISMADMAIFPFIRQFAYVDKSWFDNSPYKKCQEWLAQLLMTNQFSEVMQKYPQWRFGDAATFFNDV